MKRFFSVKVSLSILLTLSALLGAFFLGRTVTKVFATTDGWVNIGGCIAPCNSSAGKQQQSKTTPGYTTPKVCEKTCMGVTEPFSASHTVYADDSVVYGSWSTWSSCLSNNKCSQSDKDADICEDSHSECPASTDKKRTRTVTHLCPIGYTYAEQNGPDDCFKVETFSATITYGEKSNDPTKCHKETPVTPSIPSWASNEFNALPQTKDKIDSTNCTGGVWVPESTEYREIDCTATIIACSSSCGNNEVEAGEQCDDGNIMGGDGCSSTCQSETSSCPTSWIGDSNCDEVCNNAENNWDGGDCETTTPVCGNGTVEIGEQCDDGNLDNTDECPTNCMLEEPTDYCANLDGDQTTIPDGMEVVSESFCQCKEGYNEVNSDGQVVAQDGLSNFTCVAKEPTPTPTPNPDLCLNIDGIQYTVPEGLHINATGVECVAYGTPGVEQPSSSSTGTVLGASTSVGGGQVLGASTMAGTGSFDQMAYQAIMVLGGTLSAFGIKNFKKASKKA